MGGELRCVAPTGDVCGEGAVWAAAEGRLYWTDINRFLIHALSSRQTGACGPGSSTSRWWRWR